MNNVTVGLKGGEKIKLENIDFQKLLNNINNFKGDHVTFMTFNDVIFVVQNIEYIKKD